MIPMEPLTRIITISSIKSKADQMKKLMKSWSKWNHCTQKFHIETMSNSLWKRGKKTRPTPEFISPLSSTLAGTKTRSRSSAVKIPSSSSHRPAVPVRQFKAYCLTAEEGGHCPRHAPHSSARVPLLLLFPLPVLRKVSFLMATTLIKVCLFVFYCGVTDI